MDEQENPLTDTVLRISPAPVEDVRDRFWEPVPKKECYCGQPVEGRNYPYADTCRACRIKAERNTSQAFVQSISHLCSESVTWDILGWE